MKKEEFLAQLDGELQPIRDLAFRFIQTEGLSEQESANCVRLSRRPILGAKAFALKMYMPLSKSKLRAYERIHRFAIPDGYRQVLQKLNGMRAFELSLFGAPPSMVDDVPLLDRSGSNPLDLASANQAWIASFRVDRTLFYFGGSPYSYEENVGYFLDPKGKISAFRKNGKPTGSWISFRSFLTEELRRLEQDYIEFEASHAEEITQVRSLKSTKKRRR